VVEGDYLQSPLLVAWVTIRQQPQGAAYSRPQRCYPMEIQHALAQEWTTLQNNHEAQERNALWLKLVGVLLVATSWMTGLEPLLAAALVLVLWLQEAVLKTWQHRLAERLLVIEGLFTPDPQAANAAFQLHTQWQAQRPGLGGLFAEYGRSALRPTVAYPYALLCLLLLLV